MNKRGSSGTRLIFHGGANDLNILQGLGMRLNSCKIYDTQLLYAAYVQKDSIRPKLSFILDQLAIDDSYLHNAGNDSNRDKVLAESRSCHFGSVSSYDGRSVLPLNHKYVYL